MNDSFNNTPVEHTQQGLYLMLSAAAVSCTIGCGFLCAFNIYKKCKARNLHFDDAASVSSKASSVSTNCSSVHIV